VRCPAAPRSWSSREPSRERQRDSLPNVRWAPVVDDRDWWNTGCDSV
ncbi:MAG: hypothetical protein AVDCRST_MAG87-289, partial [uncultured Thermomicrobiales bacterium]